MATTYRPAGRPPNRYYAWRGTCSAAPIHIDSTLGVVGVSPGCGGRRLALSISLFRVCGRRRATAPPRAPALTCHRHRAADWLVWTALSACVSRPVVLYLAALYGLIGSADFIFSFGCIFQSENLIKLDAPGCLGSYHGMKFVLVSDSRCYYSYFWHPLTN